MSNGTDKEMDCKESIVKAFIAHRFNGSKAQWHVNVGVCFCIHSSIEYFKGRDNLGKKG
jgi:hypothetical protein